MASCLRGVNSKCAHQVHAPLRRIQGLIRVVRVGRCGRQTDRLSLFIVQRDQWIDSRRSPSGKVTGDGRYEQHERDGSQYGRRVSRREAEQERRDESARRQGREHTNRVNGWAGLKPSYRFVWTTRSPPSVTLFVTSVSIGRLSRPDASACIGGTTAVFTIRRGHAPAFAPGRRPSASTASATATTAASRGGRRIAGMSPSSSVSSRRVEFEECNRLPGGASSRQRPPSRVAARWLLDGILTTATT